MKGLLLAVGFTTAHAISVTILFRTFRVGRKAAAVARVFLALLPAFIVLHGVLPPDLGILPEWLTEPFVLVDLAFGLLLYAAFVFGGILQLYAQADRGFSLRLLLDAANAPGGTSVAEAMTSYSDGRGITWMCRRRIAGMVDQGLISVAGDYAENLPKGCRAAKLFGWLRAFLRLD